MTHVVLFELTVGDEVSNADEILQETLTQTRAFPGNEGVRVLQDAADARKYVIEITWASFDRYDAYLAWRQSPEGANQLMSIISGAPVFRRMSSTLEL